VSAADPIAEAQEQQDAQAMKAYRAGRFTEARDRLKTLVPGLDPKTRGLDFILLGIIQAGMFEFAPAAEVLEKVLPYRGNELRVLNNLAFCYLMTERRREGIKLLERAVALQPDNIGTYELLTQAHGDLGEMIKARHYGETCLKLKDRQHSAEGQAHAIVTPVPPFRAEQPEENVISYSLFGDQAKYCQGAIQNAVLAEHLFPCWSVWVYCDTTVPEVVRNRLSKAGARVIVRKPPQHRYHALLWRFEVADDHSVARYIVRDCDALLSIKERMAVDEWIASEKHFHIIRDFHTHAELILAGLWGGVHGALPSMRDMLMDYCRSKIPVRHIDQHFLRACVWPTAKQSVLIHDSLFRSFGAKLFPRQGHFHPNRHVGQNANLGEKPPAR